MQTFFSKYLKDFFSVYEKLKLSSIGRFVSFVLYRFFINEDTYRAAALTFVTLLAIVPLMVVSFSIFAAFPVFHNFYQPIQDFIFEHFVPTTGKVVQQYLQLFVQQSSKLSLWGTLFLIVTALLVMFTVEQALNQIWRVRTRRKGLATLLLYWAVLTLVPILMGVSLVISSYLISLPLIQGTPAIRWTQGWLFRWLPFLLTALTFTLVYIVIPNYKVRIRHAVVGGLFGAILFELARAAFATYLTRYPTYQLLYGAFATIPLFFLWVYWVWVIVLLGAEVTHALAAHYSRRVGHKLDPFTHALRWLKYLWNAQQSGSTFTLEQLINHDIYNYQVEPDEQIAALLKAKLIAVANNGTFILGRELSQLTVAELHRLLPWPLPEAKNLKETSQIEDGINLDLLLKVDSATQEILSTPVTQLFVRGALPNYHKNS